MPVRPEVTGARPPGQPITDARSVIGSVPTGSATTAMSATARSDGESGVGGTVVVVELVAPTGAPVGLWAGVGGSGRLPGRARRGRGRRGGGHRVGAVVVDAGPRPGWKGVEPPSATTTEAMPAARSWVPRVETRRPNGATWGGAARRRTSGCPARLH